MARQTRAQRRARRAQMPGGEAALPGGPRPPAARAEPRPEPTREREPRREARGGFGRFVGESWAELKKVEWPGQNQIIQGVTVVLIACIVVGAFLWASDLVLKRFVENVLLGQ